MENSKDNSSVCDDSEELFDQGCLRSPTLMTLMDGQTKLE